MAWIKGQEWILPDPPGTICSTAPCPMDAPLPDLPFWSPEELKKEKLSGLCMVAWTRYLVLLQYWEDAKAIHPYGGPVCHESKLMLFCLTWLNHLLEPYGRRIYLHDIFDKLPWNRYYSTHFTEEECQKHRADYAQLQAKLCDLSTWLTKRSIEEVTEEIRSLCMHRSSQYFLDYFPNPRVVNLDRLGYEGAYHRALCHAEQQKPQGTTGGATGTVSIPAGAEAEPNWDDEMTDALQHNSRREWEAVQRCDYL